ncbi:MAG: menaquinone biosynthesis decarboxylase [Syntrophomonadaceae bacterium]|nr:menaquinone biosynthesis decarboxylase [Syntrophomonadaceae bacterium]
MAYQDLQEFIADLDRRGWLARVSAPVDPELEITEIADRVSKAYGPALLFEQVKGSDIPLLINALGSYERMALALGVKDFSEISARIEELLGMVDQVPDSLVGKLRLLPRLARLSSYMPKRVKHGPCQEVVITDNPSLDMLPILKCWPKDGGRYLTLPLVFTRDPESGRPNMGMYRMQVYDSRTTGMHWHTHHDGAENYRRHCALGRPTEVAVALGGDPATIYAATAPLPREVFELVFAGFLREQPVEVVRCRTVDLEVPAHAEIILEGYVNPGETRLEGPFGDHTGYYSLADYFPVFHLTCITHRRHPVYPTTIVGKPPMEDCYMAKATERIFLPLLRLQLPEVVDINLPLEGVFHNCVLVSIRKSFPRQAKKVMHALWGMGQMMFAKFIVVVDEAVNVQNVSEVAWKVFNNVDPRRDIEIVEGPLDVLDHSSPTPLYGAKVGIDATKKFPGEGHAREWPDDIEMTPEIKALVDRRWSEYGLG